MKKTILTGILAAAAGCGVLAAQSAQSSQSAQSAQVSQQAPVAPQPKVKSQAEAEAVNNMIKAQAAGPDAVIKAADDLLTKFADTEFKEAALTFEANAYQQKGDYIKAEVVDEDILKANPKNITAEVQLGELTANHTGENDLDKEEKLNKAEKLLGQATDNLKTAPKPNAQVTDAQWEGYKKQETAQVQSDLGRVNMLRKKYDDAIAQYKAANDTDPQPAYQAYLAMAYQKAGKNDEALAVCDKLLSDPQLNPAIKQYAQNVQKAATAAKSAK